MSVRVCSVASIFVLMLYIQLVSSQLPADQVSAMTSIYEIIQNNTASSFVWNDVLSSPCSWKGVVCSSDNSSINSISFNSFSISTSEFLPFLCNISTLESLDVSHNQLSSMPEGFYTGCGETNGLKLLNFSGNELKGSFPSFNGFTVLENLDLSRNSLSGEISQQLDGLGSLKSLDLSWNQFTGKIPTNLGKMNLLEEIVLSANFFRGEIPVEMITKYSNLRVIDLSANQLSGSIPRELGELTSLQTLLLSANHLSGGIPASLTNITTLRRFAANQNGFNGTIPSGITSYLAFLDLSYNELTGTIPSDLLSGPNLQALDLSSNKLEGSIPAINSTKLFRLRLGSNSLNGTIPSDSLGSLVELMYLELDGNSISGGIPSELGMLRKLALLNLAQNRLAGVLPPELGDLINIQVLSLQSNNFVGVIPPEILQLNKLEKLNMSKNLLNGSIPLSISRMQNLRNLDLQGNNLHGPIPDSIGNLSSLIELQLGNNQLSGRIPIMPEKLQIALNLSYNLFDGSIPSSLSRLQGLEVLDLSNNRFSGEIPDFLIGLDSLTHLLLMNNELSGIFPVFRNHVVVDTTGNNQLVYLNRNPSATGGRRTKGISLTVAIVIAVVGAAMAVGLSVVIFVFISRRYNRIHVNLLSPNRSNIDFRKAFEVVADPSNIKFKTRFSTYYKAVLPSGATYFMKKVNQSDKMFRLHGHHKLGEELQVLGNLSNPNLMIPFAYLLTLRGAYLFYDFAPEGTLFDILHRATGSSTLDWAKRYSIAIGVSQGLASLHQCRSGQILLLDLSSKSILLKSPNEPQIGDIELCRVINPSKSTGSISAVAGSAGYVPPEYAYTMRVTAAGNVYSLGVVLLELLTGKAAVNEGTELAKWVMSISNDEILDSNIVSETETSIGVRDQMLGVLEVAIACISISPEMRPNMMSVLKMLLDTRSN
ncbi:leucine-rich repeat transmembrane protein kinase family protein [Perilla frutescens var. hirtella]|nr:leucine-rich repeat transmembrane protein kinase family protein [Perilla frutescens var. hirtella]